MKTLKDIVDALEELKEIELYLRVYKSEDKTAKAKARRAELLAMRIPG